MSVGYEVQHGLRKLYDRNENGSTPLHTAAGNGADDIVRYLLELPSVNPVSDKVYQHKNISHLATSFIFLS